jgi:MFS transporter, DHA1 family, multidrug resistance protein
VGRKPIIVGCGFLSAGSMVVYALAHGVWWIFASRVLAGFGGANVVVAQAYLADTTSEDARAAAMGRMGAATTAGLIIGPAVGGWLAAQGGNALVGWVAASASALGALWVWVSVPRGAPPRDEGKAGHRFLDLSLLRDTPVIRPLFVVAAVGFFALACLEGTFGRLIRHKLGYGPREFGLIFGYEALLGVVIQGALLDQVSHRLSPKRLLPLAYGLQGIGLALMPFMPNLFALFGASTLFAAGTSFANPTLNTLCSEATPEPRQGEMFGLLQSTRSLGFLLGPLLGGVLFDWRPEAPYLLAGGIAAVVALIAGRIMTDK